MHAFSSVVLIFDGHACESTWLKIIPVCMCIDVYFMLAYVTICSYV